MSVAALVLALIAIALDGAVLLVLRRRRVHWQLDINGRDPKEVDP
jgi:hypothetical protein